MQQAPRGEVEQDVGIWIEWFRHNDKGIYDDPQDHHTDERDDEYPAPRKVGDTVGKPLPQAQLPVKFDIDIYSEKCVVYHCLSNSLFQHSELIFLSLQNLLDIKRPKTVEISSADVPAG